MGSKLVLISHLQHKKAISKYVTHFFACSDVAGKWMYGGKYEFEVIPNGINLDSFRFNYEYRKSLRKTYDIEDNDVVLGSVGRLENVKNHIEGKEIVKVVIIPKKLVNIVVK